MIDPIIRRAAFALLAAVMLAVSGCGRSERAVPEMDLAENLMEAHPDSALTLLSTIDTTRLADDQAKARYALLMSMALDKNYIDTTNFNVLQPAIDYYFENGTPDEKLRTYYYQGVIFLNKGERDNALSSFEKGTQMFNESSDSLTIARLLVAQGLIYNELFDFDSSIKHYLEAADIYKSISKERLEVDCLLCALNGSILLENRQKCDSLLTLLSNTNALTRQMHQRLQRHRIYYATLFCSKDDIQRLIHQQEKNLSSQNDILMQAHAYSKIGENEKAKNLLDYVVSNKQPYDTIRYLAISVSTLEGLGLYKEALAAYKRFSYKHDLIDMQKFKRQIQVVEEKQRIELKAQEDARHKSLIIWICIGVISLLALGSVILLLLVRSNRSKKDLAVEKAKTAELEKQKIQAERDKKALEAENLAHRVAVLEHESKNLKELLDAQEELPREVQKEIRTRIEMLNSLLAGYITSNDNFGQTYDTWGRKLTKNTEDFMNSTRLAFQVSHPRFIQYFKDHDLTTKEINYVCLYAIGLKGKDVGEYIKKPGHVNISSAIRKKLGIDKHETNLGIYVRRLMKEL